MHKFIIGAIAALFVILSPAETRAQIAFFYKEWPDMALDNENVEIQTSVKLESQSYNGPILHVRIKNKSAETLYVDLGNTFITVNDESRCYYTPSSTSTTEGCAHGAGINLGLVSVGGGVSSSETTTTFAQRVLAIPPMSAKNLELQQLLVLPVPEMGIYCDIYESYDNMVFPRCQSDAALYPRVPEGETWTFDPHDKTIRFSVMVTCSFEESCAETFTLRRGYYVHRTACYKNWPGIKFWNPKNINTLSEKGRQKMLGLFPDWDSWGDFFLLNSSGSSKSDSLVE